MKIQDFFSKHKKVALMFSGGKDSIVCLELIKNYLDKTYVVWVNTQANFPEITSLMDYVRKQVPNFIEVTSNQPEAIKTNGYPTDVTPINYTVIGQLCTEEKPIKLRSYFDCCGENIWVPAQKAVQSLGVTGVIRGQRNDEEHRGPIKSGYVENGVEYFLPIESWTSKDVINFLQENNIDVGDRLNMSHSSLDCWDCTAFCNNSAERMNYIKKNHPDKHMHILEKLKQINHAVSSEMVGLQQLLGV